MTPQLCLAHKVIGAALVRGTNGRALLLTCVLPSGHQGEHRCGEHRWEAAS